MSLLLRCYSAATACLSAEKLPNDLGYIKGRLRAAGSRNQKTSSRCACVSVSLAHTHTRAHTHRDTYTRTQSQHAQNLLQRKWNFFVDNATLPRATKWATSAAPSLSLSPSLTLSLLLLECVLKGWGCFTSRNQRRVCHLSRISHI